MTIRPCGWSTLRRYVDQPNSRIAIEADCETEICDFDGIRILRWGVDRKSPQSPPCRRRRRPKSHLRGRPRSLPAPPSPACRRRESTLGARPVRSSTPATAARLAESPGAGPFLPRSTTIRPNSDRPRCALSYPSMSVLDFSEWPLPMRRGRSLRKHDHGFSELLAHGCIVRDSENGNLLSRRAVIRPVSPLTGRWSVPSDRPTKASHLAGLPALRGSDPKCAVRKRASRR
jgi:hypothetical protein